MRQLFVQNIPFLRGLDLQTIRPLTLLMKPQIYDQGDQILANGDKSTKILILWEGNVQVRVTRQDPILETTVDIWFDNLSRGACIDVYNAIDPDRQTLVDYYANSKHCIVYKIDV